MIMAVFDDDVKVSKDAFHELISYLRDNSRTNNAIYIHSELNLLYLCYVFGYNDCFSKSLKEFGYKPELYSEEMDPLLKALKANNPVILDIFSLYLGGKKGKVMPFKLTPDLYFSALSC